MVSFVVVIQYSDGTSISGMKSIPMVRGVTSSKPLCQMSLLTILLTVPVVSRDGDNNSKNEMEFLDAK